MKLAQLNVFGIPSQAVDCIEGEDPDPLRPNGSLHVDVEATFSLDDIKTALEHTGREAPSGKVLITPNGPLP